MIEIIVPDENDSLVNVSLDGAVYSLHFKWNSVGEFWSMGIADDEENVLIESIKIVPNYPLTGIYKTPDYPPGEFIAVVELDSISKIGRESFNDGSASFIYIEEAEVDAVFESS